MSVGQTLGLPSGQRQVKGLATSQPASQPASLPASASNKQTSLSGVWAEWASRLAPTFASGRLTLALIRLAQIVAGRPALARLHIQPPWRAWCATASLRDLLIASVNLGARAAFRASSARRPRTLQPSKLLHSTQLRHTQTNSNVQLEELLPVLSLGQDKRAGQAAARLTNETRRA